MELISNAFRIAFRDHCSEYLVLSQIRNIFGDTGMRQEKVNPERLSTFTGQRRTLVEEYYASVNWSNEEDIQKFLKVLNNFFILYGREEDTFLRHLLKEEGFTIEGNVVSSGTKVRLGANVKNLIFACNGNKPEIVLIDALNNDIKIVRNEEYCLVYKRPILESGLFWQDLENWWQEEYRPESSQKTLYSRLLDSLASEPEKLLFQAYFFYSFSLKDAPALIPQVYLHYDPYTIRQLPNGKRLPRQRMDFLMLLPNNVRIVIEVDGKQHYSKKNSTGEFIASPELYSEMVAEDRRLKLAGYELYRFGGYELYGINANDTLCKFFEELFKYHSISEECF